MTFERLTDYDTGDASLPMGYNDFTMSPGTRVVFDAKDPACYPAGIVPPGTTPAGSYFSNLVNDQAELFVSVSAGVLPAMGTTGITFDAPGQRIILPASVKNPATVTAFGFGGWIKPTAQAVTGNQYASPFSHITGGTAVTTDWTCQCQGTTPNNYAMRAEGLTLTTTLAVDTVTFLFGYVVVDQSAKTITFSVYKDGILVGSNGPTAWSGSSFPVLGGDAVLGSSSVYSGPGWRGQIGRFVFQDFSVAGAKTIAQFLADEMTQGAGPRFT